MSFNPLFLKKKSQINVFLSDGVGWMLKKKISNPHVAYLFSSQTCLLRSG